MKSRLGAPGLPSSSRRGRLCLALRSSRQGGVARLTDSGRPGRGAFAHPRAGDPSLLCRRAGGGWLSRQWAAAWMEPSAGGLTPGPSFALAGAPGARQSPPSESAAGANSHCTKIGFTSLLEQLKGTAGCIGPARPRRASHLLVVPLGVKLLGLFGGQVMGGCRTWWLAWPGTGVTGLTSV